MRDTIILTIYLKHLIIHLHYLHPHYMKALYSIDETLWLTVAVISLGP